jgi:hypothetical protein
MLGRSYCCLNVSAPISNTGEGEFRWNATTTLEFRCAYPKLANSHFEKSRGHNLDSRCGRRRVPLPPISSRTSRWGEGCPRVQQRHTQLQPGGSASVANQTSFLFPGASLAPVAPERPRGRRPFPPRRSSPPPSLAQRPVLAASNPGHSRPLNRSPWRSSPSHEADPLYFEMKAEDVAREEGIAPRQKKESEPV